MVRVLEKPIFCVEIKYRHWESPDCVHKDGLPAWGTYGTYSIFCKLHRTFSDISRSQSAQEMCGCHCASQHLFQCYTAHWQRPTTHPGVWCNWMNSRKFRELLTRKGLHRQWLLIEPIWSFPSVPSPGASKTGNIIQSCLPSHL